MPPRPETPHPAEADIAALSPTIARVVRFLQANHAVVIACSAAELAQRIGTSDASVVRAAQALGFSACRR
ncbi:hypothetical protein ACFQY5_22655 [Paeniroseomonas aquatica]|uniref:hypothetical protein n=1 Tax=Paeniroseomonas aquatica TaxID=373043 RepID=UPI003617B8B4